MKRAPLKLLSVLVSALIAFACCVPAFSEQGGELVLAESGKALYSIIVSANASKAELFAADELADHLKKISSADFSVMTDDSQPQENEIVVGVTNREGENGIDRSALGDDGVMIFTRGKKIFLTGAEKRGAVYSVFTFLEDHLGCRWFTEELTVIPENDRPTVSADIDYTFVPPFRLRQTYWLFSTRSAEFCVKHKLHGVMAYVDDSMGGCGEEYAVNSVHTLQWMITRDMFETHPEYFGCNDEGVRSANRQPCLSNEDVFNIAVDFALNFFSQYNTILSISQNDGMQFCRCEKCVAFNEAHGGTDSASMVNFVNRVAAAVREKYPDARFETLAYQDSLAPPENLEVSDGVVIRMCPVNGCVLHDFDDPHCKKNAAFNKAMKGWTKLTENIYMWNYSTDFQYYYALFPNVTTLQGRYRYFRENNVVSVFDNGCGEDMVPAELHELKTYLVLKLMWDPDTDVERHISEFCSAYYGEAGADVVEFINNFEKDVNGFNPLTFSTCHMTCQDGGESLENNTALSEAEIKRLDKIMERAMSRELTAEQRQRLNGFSISWRFFKCGTFAGEFNWFSIKNDPQKEAEKLYNDMKDYGIGFLSEGGGVQFSGEPDFTVRPTWWFSQKSGMPMSIRFESAVLPVINRILRLFNIFG